MYTADIEKEADQQMVDNVLIARFIIMVTAIIFLIITQITIYQSNRTRFWPFFLMQIFFTYNLLYYALLIIEEIFNIQILCPYYGYLKYVFTLIILSSQLILLYYYLMMLHSFYPCNEKQKEYYIYLSQLITNDKIKFIIFLNLFSATTNLVPLLQTNFDITLEQYKNKSQHICNFNINDSKDFYQYIANWVLIVFLISIVSLILYIKIRNIVNGKYMNTHEHNFIMGICKIPLITLFFQILTIVTIIGNKYIEKQEQGYQYYIFLTLSFVDEASIILTNFIFLRENYKLVQMKKIQTYPNKKKAVVELSAPNLKLESNKQMFLSSAGHNQWNDDSSESEEDEKYILMIEDLFKQSCD
ncbi:hypothetical protein pb186bvf_011178 [Paramecium bursaria]